MNLLPGPAQFYQAIHQYGYYVPDLLPREFIILPKLYWSCRTVQVDYRFATSTHHVYMGRSMVVWINQAGVRVRRCDFIELQPVRGVQVADALGKRLHKQPGAIEDLIFTSHWGIARRVVRRGTESWG